MEANLERQQRWKHSVLKRDSHEISSEERQQQLGVKFSPHRNIESHGIKAINKFKHKHDQSSIKSPRQMSIKKLLKLQDQNVHRNSIKDCFQSNLMDQNQTKRDLSFDLTPMNIKLGKNLKLQQDNSEFIQQLKLEFNRFKDKVLNQLKRQEDQLNKNIQQIYALLQDKYTQTTTYQPQPIGFQSFKHSPFELKTAVSGIKHLDYMPMTSKSTSNILMETDELEKISSFTPRVEKKSNLKKSEYHCSPKIHNKFEKLFGVIDQLKAEMSFGGQRVEVFHEN